MEVYYCHPFKSHFYDFGGSYYLLLDQIDFFPFKRSDYQSHADFITAEPAYYWQMSGHHCPPALKPVLLLC